jgi:hypothetical protein
MARATNIVGEDHKKYVHDQINTRQKILGSSLRDSEQLTYINGRTAWIRVVSSVDISDQDLIEYSSTGSSIISDGGQQYKLNELGLNSSFAGNNLSSNLSLLAGTTPSGGNLKNQLKYGVVESQFDRANGPAEIKSYGFGGSDFGLKAPPGVLGFNTSNLNKGALRISNIELQANNQEQFQYIETLYLRLGYTVLVEWGDTQFYRQLNNGNTEYVSGASVSTYSLASEFLSPGNVNKLDTETLLDYFYRRIEELREKTQGNYDALVGKVKNFSWSLDEMGIYHISLELVSYGDVIESLSINNTLADVDIDELNLELGGNTSTTEGIKYISALEAFIKVAGHFPQTVSSRDAAKGQTTRLNKVKTLLTGQRNYSKGLNYTRGKALPIACRAWFDVNSPIPSIVDKPENVYIRFGDILDFINAKCVFYDQDKKQLIKIDTSEDNNLGYSNGYSVSADPNKVLVRAGFTLALNQDLFEDLTVDIFNSGEKISEFHSIDGSGTHYCKIMNLYFNTQFLNELLQAETDTEDGIIDLYSFLKSLLDAANQALGSVNQFSLRLSNDNTLQIYDEVRPVGYQSLIETQNDPSVFNLYGLPNNEGSFVTNYSIQSQLTKNFATVISIGAQANGRAVGEDATFFSKWNLGLKDRIVPQKLDYNSLVSDRLKSIKQVRQLILNYLFFLSQYGFVGLTDEQKRNAAKYIFVEFVDVAVFPFPLESIPKSIKAQKDFFNYFLSLDAEKQNVLNPTVGFIPINLGLTLDGISGLRLFDKLRVDTRILPKNYHDKIDFIIKTLNHRIGLDNKWITEIETLSVPKLDGAKQAEINLDVQELVSTDLILTNNDIDSYFVVSRNENPILFKAAYNGSLPVGNVRTKVTPQDIVKSLNSSDYVQSQFLGFFNEILSTLPKGFEFQINSNYRPIGRGIGANKSTALSSAHLFGLAIDMQINQAVSNISSGPGTTIAGRAPKDNPQPVLDKWTSTQIPLIAVKWGINWGTEYEITPKKGGPTYIDSVHFAIDGGESQSGNLIYNFISGDLQNLITNQKAWKPISNAIQKDLEKDVPMITSNVQQLGKGTYGYKVPGSGLISINRGISKDNLSSLNLKDYVRVTKGADTIVFSTDKATLQAGSDWRIVNGTNSQGDAWFGLPQGGDSDYGLNELK